MLKTEHLKKCSSKVNPVLVKGNKIFKVILNVTKLKSLSQILRFGIKPFQNVSRAYI